MILNVDVISKIATFQKRGGCIVCGNSDYQIQFSFDREWDAYDEKTARFIYNGQFIDVDFSKTKDNNICAVPILHDTTEVEIGVYAGELKTTTSAFIGCHRSILCEVVKPSEENDRLHINEAKEAADRAEESAKLAEEYAGKIVTEGGGISADVERRLKKLEKDVKDVGEDVSNLTQTGIVEVNQLPTENINKNVIYLCMGKYYKWTDTNTWLFKAGSLTDIRIQSWYYDIHVDCSGYIYNEETGEYDEFSEFIFWQGDGGPNSIEIKNAKTGREVILYREGSFVDAYRHRTVTFIVPPTDEMGTTDWLEENATEQSYLKQINFGVDIDTTLSLGGHAADAKAVGDILAKLEQGGLGIIAVVELPTDNIDKNALYVCGGEFYQWFEDGTWLFKEGELGAIRIQSMYYDVYVDCSGYIYNEETGEYDEFSDFIFWDIDTGNPTSIEFKNAKTGKRIIFYKDGSFVYPYRHRTVTFIVPPTDEMGTTDWLEENATEQGAFRKVNFGGDQKQHSGDLVAVNELPTDGVDRNKFYVYDGRCYKWVDSNAWKFNQLLTPLAAYAGGYQDIYFDCSGYFYHTERDEDIEFTELRFDIDPTDGTVYRINVKEFESGEFIEIHYGSNGVDQFVKDETITFSSLPDDDAFLAWLNENATSLAGFKSIMGLNIDTTLTESGKAADAWTVGNEISGLGGRINRHRAQIERLENTVIRGVATEAEMDEILEEAPTYAYTGNCFYMFIGETTEKYKKGAVYNLKEVT